MAVKYAAPKSAEGAQAVENVRLTVRALLAVRGVSALELARTLQVSRAAIYERTQGRRAFTVDEVALMARVFGVPVQAFFDGPEALVSGHARYMGGAVRGQTNPHLSIAVRSELEVAPAVSSHLACDNPVNPQSPLVTDCALAA